MSYFNHPVRVTVFQQSVVGLVERLLRKAGKTEKILIQVLFTGSTACAAYGDYGTVIRGTIKLPELKSGSVIDRDKANRWVAYVIHEVWHVVFTHADEWRSFAIYNPGLKTFLANAIEDARIERSGMALGYADGFKIVGRDLLQHLMATGGMDVNPNDPKQIPWVFAIGCRGYGIKGERRLLTALDPRIAVILAESKRRCDAIPAEIDPKAGTKASCQIALWAYEELKKLGQQPALPPGPDGQPGEEGEPKGKQPKQPKGKPGTSDDDRPKSDDDSDREAGSADDESYDDEGDDDWEDEEGEDGDGAGGSDVPLRVGDKVVCPDGSKGRITAIDGDDATVGAL